MGAENPEKGWTLDGGTQSPAAVASGRGVAPAPAVGWISLRPVTKARGPITPFGPRRGVTGRAGSVRETGAVVAP